VSQDPQRALIIGAGMAGLSTACYLQMNGFNTTIVEQQARPGGLCTSWQREGYTFDGCIHWLLGSSPASPFHRIWDELVDMAAIDFVDHELYAEVDVVGQRAPDGASTFSFYSDLARLEAEMKRISPADAKQIERFISVPRMLQRHQLPPLIHRAPALRTLGEKLSLLKLWRLGPGMARWFRVSNVQLARQFESPFLAEMLANLFDSNEKAILMLAFPMAFFDQRCAGYPVGGSLAFMRRIEQRYRALGGEMLYNSPVERIEVQSDRATGLRLTDGERLEADLVISAADGHWTIFEALQGKYVDKARRELYAGQRLKTFPSLLLTSLGVARTFEGAAPARHLALPEPWTLPDGTKIRRVSCRTYSYDPTLAPPGKTVLNVLLTTYNHAFWRDLRRDDVGAYHAAKREVTSRIVTLLDERLGGIRDSLEALDLATPATVTRYTSNWRGSYQGWIPGGFLSTRALPKTLPGLRGFYMAGQWVEVGGGLPPALLSGRNLAQEICARAGRTFRVTPRPCADTANAANTTDA
jgi:phytoene dehydrogenase-like protein